MNYVLLTELSGIPKEIQVAMFENCLDDAMKIYQDMQFVTVKSEQTVQKIKDALKKYAFGVMNETYKCYVFHQRKQDKSKIFHVFFSNLQVLSKMCNFCNNYWDSLMKSQIITGVKDNDIRQDLLKV